MAPPRRDAIVASLSPVAVAAPTKMRTLLFVTTVLACTALAGCSGGDGDGTSTSPTPTRGADYEIDAYDGIPATGTVDVEFTFQVDINGPARYTPHIGGHYWNSTVPDPDPTSAEHTALRKNCDHQPGDIPGDFTVTCTIHEEGVHTLYAHAQVTVNGVTRDLWDGPFTIDVSAAS